MATMVVVPLVVFLALDQLEAATWASVAALHVGVVDVGGAHVDRLRAGLAATASIAATVVVATLVSGSLWAVVSLTMVWVFAGALAAAFGLRAARVALVTAITFIVGAAAPAAAAQAWTRGGMLVIGGLWGVFVTVSMWPIRRDGPVRDAIADAFERIGVFVGDMPHDPQATGAARARIAESLVAARDATVQYQRSHSGPDPTAATAVAALDAIDTLELGLDTIDEAARDVDDTALADSLGGLAGYCRRFASAVRARQPAPARPSLPRSPGDGASADARTVREAMVVIDRALERLGRSSTEGPAPLGPSPQRTSAVHGCAAGYGRSSAVTASCSATRCVWPPSWALRRSWRASTPSRMRPGSP